MSYRPFEALVAPARESAQLWRLAMGLVIVTFVVLGFNQAIFTIAGMLLDESGYRSFVEALSVAEDPVSTLVLLLSAGSLALGAFVAAHLMHQREPFGLLGPLPLVVRQFGQVFLGMAALYLALAILPPYAAMGSVEPGLSFPRWLAWLPLSLLVLLFQTGGEEIFFRGYVQQQIAARFGHPLVWVVVPSLLFAVGHYSPEIYGDNALWIVLWAFVFGLLMADLTARSGSLGPAIAVHLANNFSAILFVSLQGPMSGLALYRTTFGPSDTMALGSAIWVEFAMLLVSWLTARVALRR